MTTLIAVHNGDGLVGRCDAHCYNAKHEHCTCVCGGKNHGVGKEQALANVKEVVDNYILNVGEVITLGKEVPPILVK